MSFLNQLGYPFFRYAMVAAFATAIFLVVFTFVAARSQVASRLGMKGLQRKKALETNELFRSFEPLIRWMGARFAGVLPEGFYRDLDSQLGQAGDYLGINPNEYVGLSVLSGLFGLVFGVIIGALLNLGSLAVILCGPLFTMLPYLQISGEAARRRKEVSRGLPFSIDIMSLAMSAGLDFPSAIRQVVDKSSNADDALIGEFERILREFQLGKTRKQALLEFYDRLPIEPVREFVNAIVQAEERGNPVAEVLQIQAAVSRGRRSVRAEELAAKAGVAMVAPLFLLFFCVLLLIVAPMILKLSTVQ